ncbi:MAG: nucleotidyltransferase domain-containing protein [Clostridiales bacterium]|jgi:predicted nucleotidyltransferase|nr:nucleotidyltransferase domain-containing protein [Clostridiales bacterium]
MKLEHYPEDKIKDQIIDIVGKYLDLSLYRIFIFGSRVSGFNSERSDIDIGIQGPEEIPGNIRVEILEDLENLPVLYKFDVVDFSKVSLEFKKKALENIEYAN